MFMYSVKYGLSKYLKEKCRIDISTDNDFVTAIKTFKAKLTDLQKKGKGSVVHRPQIADYDMKKLMDPFNVAFNVNTPCGLQNKVWFDIMYHLCRRGRENLRVMKKTTFAMEVDSSGREFVRKIMDEADKNHGIDSTPDDTIVDFIQTSMTYDSGHVTVSTQPMTVGFVKVRLGGTYLISTTAALSQKYTNHCIRATSISALDIAGFEARHITRATGHKSETSIKSYASRLTEGTTREMSDALSSAFLGAEQNAPMTSNIVPELSAHDLDQIFSAENDFSYIRS
ncbi:hypothetical protein MAR_003787 [Mya arenaria]|uniref:Uncharacterized protein n=1 Tax=Mya arenaria TaxID=6604 RepID=A0ABY7EWQ5_MYAAR|nr:hypothetical protein MAR_003787 [Mya arenaria]